MISIYNLFEGIDKYNTKTDGQFTATTSKMSANDFFAQRKKARKEAKNSIAARLAAEKYLESRKKRK